MLHVKVQIDGGQHSCKECSYTAPSKTDLINHIQNTHVVKEYRCVECNITINSFKFYQIHRKVHDKTIGRGGRTKKFQCNMCPKVYVTAYGLKCHVKVHMGQAQFECEMCEKKLTTRPSLKVHMAKHFGTQDNVRLHKCIQCGYATINISRLREHILVHTGLKPFGCDFCSFKTAYHNNLLRHVKRHKTGETRVKGSLNAHKLNKLKTYHCDMCTFYSNQKYGLISHIAYHHQNIIKIYECSECKFNSPFVARVNDHMRNSHIEKHSFKTLTAEKHPDTIQKPVIKTYKCDTCQYETKSEYELKEHQKTHIKEKSYEKDINLMPTHSETTYECEICKYETKSEYELKEHQKTHIKEKPYESDINVIPTHSETTYECEICKYETKSELELKEHQKTHIKEKPYESDINVIPTHSETTYECEICKYVTKSEYELKEHQKTHIKEKPYESDINVIPTHSETTYECDICQYETKSVCELKEHQQTHLEEKPCDIHLMPTHSIAFYTCDICNSKFFNSASLLQHQAMHKEKKKEKPTNQYDCDNDKLKIHTTRKVIRCKICKLSFRLEEHLKRHMLTHTNESLYKCNICNSEFTSSSSLLTHQRIHEEKQLHFCDACSYKTDKKENIIDHIWNKHNMGPLNVDQFPCKMCDFKYAFASSLKQHVQAAHKKGSEKYKHTCHICNEAFPRPVFTHAIKCKIRQSRITRTASKHLNIQPYKCNKCDFTSPSVAQLEQHVSKEHMVPPKIFECNMCDYKHRLRSAVLGHMKTVHKVKEPYICKCKCSFEYAAELKQHMEKEHSDRLDCNFCEFTTIYLQDMIEHVEQNHPRHVNTYKCDKCDSYFELRSSYKAHVAEKHPETFQNRDITYVSDKSQFKTKPESGLVDKKRKSRKIRRCKLCYQSFRSKEHLRRHMPTHANRALYRCNICNTEFTSSASLTAHQRVHEEKQLYFCDACWYKTEKKENITNHISRKHMGPLIVDQFPCKMCDFKYAFASSLKQHVQAAHQKGNAKYKYVCDICNKAFTRPVTGHVIKCKIRQSRITRVAETNS